MSLVFVWVDIDCTYGVAISVCHDLEFSISRFSLSISSISILILIASLTSQHLVKEIRLLLQISLLSWLRVRKDCWYSNFS